jgi:serine protease Do
MSDDTINNDSQSDNNPKVDIPEVEPDKKTKPTHPHKDAKTTAHQPLFDRRPPKTVWASIVSVVATLVVLAVGATGGIALDRALNSQGEYVNSSSFDGNSTTTPQENSIAAVADKIKPSVVSVFTKSTGTSVYGAISQEGAGTGIIVSKDGYVMTNNHVIDGASSVTVIDSNGNEYENVTVIGRDPLNDIAFLKIQSNNTFTPAEIGNSATIRIGQQVVAIGNALGQYTNTVTSGIISGTGRPVTASDSGNQSTESLTDLIQTDASINAGNSGGPLVNLSGQVIGINTATVSSANGIGFAIPVNSAKGVLEGVLQTGKISRAYLGLSYLSITSDVVRQFNLTAKSGAYVYASNGNAIASGSPADKAGLKSGDVITKIDNYIVGTDGGLSSITGLYRPGDNATITYVRSGSTHTVQITFGTYNG